MNYIKITIHVILYNHLVVVLDNSCKWTVRVINLESLLKCVISRWWLGVRKHLSWYIVSFRERFPFLLTTLTRLEIFPAFKWVIGRLGGEDTLLSHACSPVLLEKVSLLFSVHSCSQSEKTKCGETVCIPAILILMRTLSIINYVGRCLSLLCPHYPVELLKKPNLWVFFCPEILLSSTIQTIKSRQLYGKFKKEKKKICPVF